MDVKETPTKKDLRGFTEYVGYKGTAAAHLSRVYETDYGTEVWVKVSDHYSTSTNSGVAEGHKAARAAVTAG